MISENVKTLKTSEIAFKCGIHPNTVRQYEDLGFIPKIPRAGNGYRLYSELHLEHVLMVRAALKSTWLGGEICQKALSILHHAADGNYEDAMQVARDHLALIGKEREKAEIATQHLEDWAAISDEHTASTKQYWNTKEIAEHLDISRDMLRSWERNGLITVPRNQGNGYRFYGDHEIRRLYVIRALRKARFSLMSIYNMLQHYDRGIRHGLTSILNELPADEENIFYSTTQWLTKIRSIEESAHEITAAMFSGGYSSMYEEFPGNQLSSPP
jgi:Predicted transcriptional regulators